MLNPICVECQMEMRCTKNEQQVKDRASGVFPATYWSGDEYTCQSCGMRIVTSFGQGTVDAVLDATCIAFGGGF